MSEQKVELKATSVIAPKMTIVIDDREQAVIPHFNTFKHPSNVTFKVDRLNHGDYAIVYGDRILVVIERKTWSDLASSIKDGRSKNVEKLKKIRTETGCKLIYLIEGNPIPIGTRKYGRIPSKNLRARLDHLMFRDDIHIVHSKNQKGTVEKLFELVKNYISCDEIMLELKSMSISDENDNQVIGGEALAKLKEKTQITESEITYTLWDALPSITEKTASLFIATWHISDLILGKITSEEIFMMKYSNGCVVGKRAARILRGSCIGEKNTSVFIKLLTRFHGVTKKTAEKILSAVSFKELLEGKISKETLADIQKSDTGRRVGNKCAELILKHLVKPT